MATIHISEADACRDFAGLLAVTLDSGFPRDLEAVANSHSEPLENPWN